MSEPGPDSLLQFPCEFPLKVGRPGVDFEMAVLEIVRRHGADLAEGAIRSRASRNGNYQALTITFEASSRQQLDAIYQDLSRCPAVVMAL
jgi:hypothetical protein